MVYGFGIVCCKNKSGKETGGFKIMIWIWWIGKAANTLRN